MASRWKLDRKRLIKMKDGFWQEMRKLNLRNRDGSRPAVVSPMPVRSYRDWERWMRRNSLGIEVGERR